MLLNSLASAVRYLGPAADSTRIQINGSTVSELNTDSTYNVTNVVKYTAEREHNDWRLTCSVTNKPLQSAGWEPKSSYAILDIWCK